MSFFWSRLTYYKAALEDEFFGLRFLFGGSPHFFDDLPVTRGDPIYVIDITVASFFAVSLQETLADPDSAGRGQGLKRAS